MIWIHPEGTIETPISKLLCVIFLYLFVYAEKRIYLFRHLFEFDSVVIENGMQEGDQQPNVVQAFAAHEQQQLVPGEDQSQPPSMYHQQPPAFYNFMGKEQNT